MDIISIIAKYNLANNTHFYKLEDVVEDLYNKTQSSNHASSQVALTEGPGSTIGSDILSGKVDSVVKVLQDLGLPEDEAKDLVLKKAKTKDKESTKRAAGSAMMSMLPILAITRYGLAHGAAKNLAGVAAV